MIIRAELKCKQTGCEADPCAVDKVIELPSPRFQQFSRALLADYFGQIHTLDIGDISLLQECAPMTYRYMGKITDSGYTCSK